MQKTLRIIVDKERCKGCDLCASVCPRGKLRMAKGFNKRGHHFVESDPGIECTGCLMCTDICPDAAIEIRRDGAK